MKQPTGSERGRGEEGKNRRGARHAETEVEVGEMEVEL
jgi:hypothetical protein